MGGHHTKMSTEDLHFISTKELAALLFDGEPTKEEFKLKEKVTHHVRVFDTSFGGKPSREKFQEIAIPSATFVDIGADIGDKSARFPNTYPTSEIIRTTMQDLGLTREDNIVLYGQPGKNAGAARAFFVLTSFGFKNVRVLNGGQKKWIAENLPTVHGKEYEGSKSKPSKIIEPANVVVYYEEMKQFAEGNLPDVQVVDFRPQKAFNGDADDNIPDCRQGNIPGAVSFPMSLLQNSETEEFIGDEEVKKLVVKRGLDPTKRTITMCRTGVAASLGYIALMRQGFDNLQLYDGSWSEYGSL